jgi:hypothetical protein
VAPCNSRLPDRQWARSPQVALDERSEIIRHRADCAAIQAAYVSAYGGFRRQYANSVAVGTETFQRASVTLGLSAILLSVLVVALGWSTGAAIAQGGSTPSLERSRAIPKLVPASRQLRDQCVLAATRLGFSVPCPELTPSLSGRAMACPRPVGAASALPPCVGVDGATQYSIFFLQFYGFDVPKGYSGINGKPVGHMTLEAYRFTDDPLKPCIGGRVVGTAQIGIWTTNEFACPNDSSYIERVAMHGEGVYVGHLALDWRTDGITYVASAHGHTTANLSLLKRFVRSIALISPGDSSS